MQKLILILVLVFGASFPSFADDQESWVTLPFHPKVGDTVKYHIRKSDVAEGGLGKTKPVSLMDISIKYLGKQPDGFVYQLTYTDIRPEYAPLAANPAVQQAIGLYKGISLEYLADETGTPLAVRDIGKVRKWLLGPAFDLLDKIGTSKDAIEKMRAVFMNLGPEAAAEMLLKDIGPIFLATGMQLPRDRAYEVQGTMPWQVAGTDLTVNRTSRLVSLKDEIATLEIRQGYTRESVMSGVKAAMEKILPTVPADKKAAALAQLKALESFDIRQSIDAAISLTSGWPQKVKSVAETDMGRARHIVTYEISLDSASSR